MTVISSGENVSNDNDIGSVTGLIQEGEHMNVRVYKRIGSGLAAVERQLINLMLGFDVLLTIANVISRYIVHQSWSFTEEIVVALLVLMSLIGAALCAREKGGLINMTILTSRLSMKRQLQLEILTTVLLIVLGVIMVYFGAVKCIQQATTNQLTTSLQIPSWIYSAFVPAGGVLLILHALERIMDCIYELKGEEESI